eukprot:TRINITY_DN2410_c3_g1_i3.p1 TRINITY_DN2410_c3_g1~~TRINITY_DN2410_c3_g1_i3.p1  ORF type:complete len:328 (-),score=100.86 TRINITY_DN2410_c3_g1_i3:23-1006(-)
MWKLLVLMAISATPLSALRRSKTGQVEGADEALLKRADIDSDGKASYSESASVVNQIDDVDHETAMSALEKDFRDADGSADGLMDGNELASLPAAFPDELRNLIDDEEEALDEDEEVALTEVVQEVEHKLHPDHDPKQILHAVAATLGVEDNELENAIHGHRSEKRKHEHKKDEETKEDEEDEAVALLEVVQEAELKLDPDQDPKQTLHAFAETIGVADKELENAIHSHRPTRRRRKQKKDEETNEKEETEKEEQEEKQKKKEEREKEKEEREKEKAERKKEKEERRKKEKEEREKEQEEKDEKEDKEEKEDEEDKKEKEEKDDSNI